MGIKSKVSKVKDFLTGTTRYENTKKRFPVRPLKPSKGKVPKGKPSNGIGVGY